MKSSFTKLRLIPRSSCKDSKLETENWKLETGKSKIGADGSNFQFRISSSKGEDPMQKRLVSRRHFIQGASTAGLALAAADPGSEGKGMSLAIAADGAGAPVPEASGYSNVRFRVLRTSADLPEEAQRVLTKAHGGFAVDRRPGRGETYFFLPGAGILQISSDLKTIKLLNTPEPMKKVNLHDTAIWYDPAGGAPYMVFPANDAGKIFTTTLDGRLVSTLDAPTPDDVFEQPEIGDYFLGGGNFAPTGVAYLEGLYYVTTGYCALDFVLTARVSAGNPAEVAWNDLAFGGKGNERSQFQTAHAIAVHPGEQRFEITDRMHSEIKHFTRYGHYLSALGMPMGSLPCSIDYQEEYAVVPTLVGPNPGKGAPIYIFHHDRLISTIFPQADLGLKNFKHNHKAVIRKVGGKLCIIVQAWNPGDFAILEQA
jgi:hypothetical protein